MSTKKLEEVLTHIAENPAAAADPLVQGAFAELAAIRQAAKALEGIRPTWHGEAWFARGEELEGLEKAADTMERIAKEQA